MLSALDRIPAARPLIMLGVLVLVSGCSSTREPVGSDSANAAAPVVVAEPIDSIDWNAVDAAIGRPGVAQPGEVRRFSFPRSDLKVVAAGVSLKPAFALGGWVAMKAVSGGVMAMGDLVLTEDEVNPVITSLQGVGIQQTAIHHHVLHETPRVIYVHIHGHGDAVKIGQGIRAALAQTTTPDAPAAATSGTAVDPGIDTAGMTRALGHSGKFNGGVYQVSVPRAEVIRDGSFEIPPSMGLGTAINFQPTGNGKAAITGDFVMLGSEVHAVIRALRDGGVEVTSLHNHLLNEEPRLFFMHFWANDDAVKLAGTLANALGKTNSKRGP